MLQTIDMLIGFATVMLVLSAIVTMLIQLVVTTLLNLKGRVLKEGVAHLLRLLDKDGLTNAQAVAIADAVLRNTLVAKPGVWPRPGPRLASSIHREEFIKILLDFAAEADLAKADAVAKEEKGGQAHRAGLSEALKQSLARNGLTDPKAILGEVRKTMLALEVSHAALANDVRSNMALVRHASSEFLGKMNAWFDQSIDRTVAIFTEKTRMWTAIFSLAVAVFFQVNTFDLLKRLSVDHDTTAMLVAAAVQNPDQFKPKPLVLPVTPAQPPATPAPEDAAPPNPSAAGQTVPPPSPGTITAAGEALKAIREDENLRQLVDTNLIKWPESWPCWWDYWWRPGTFYVLLLRIAGILLTVGLLSLGAPVWYELLKNLIQLRSLAARKDDEQRQVRQTNQ